MGATSRRFLLVDVSVPLGLRMGSTSARRRWGCASQKDTALRAHRAALFLDTTDGWFFDPQSLTSAVPTRKHVTVLSPLLADLLRPTGVRFMFTRGEADVTRQGQSESECAMCNGLCLVAVAAVAFCGTLAGRSVLRCIQGTRAEALPEVVRYALPQSCCC